MSPWPLLLSLVAVEVAGTPEVTVDPKTEQTEAPAQHLLAACQTALGEDSCTFEPTPDALWHARVFFEPDAVVVSLSGDSGPQRRLEFAEEDRWEQRQVAAGLLVAAMTAARLREEAEPPPEPSPTSEPEKQGEAVSEPPRPPPEPTAEKPMARRLSLQLGAAAQSVLGGGHIGGGGTVGGALWLSRRWAPALDARVLLSSYDELRATTIQAEMGVDFDVQPEASWALWLGVRGVLDWTQVNDDLVAEPAQSTLRGGASLHATAGLPAGAWGAFLRAQATILGPELRILRNEREPLAVPIWSVGGALGIRFNY